MKLRDYTDAKSLLWCYMRHGHEQIAVHSTTCAKSHICVSGKHRSPWFYRKVGFDIYPGHSGFYKCSKNRFKLICYSVTKE